MRLPETGQPHVVILGAMGVGKSTTGRALADRLGMAFRDSDADIEQLMGDSGAILADRHGIEFSEIFVVIRQRLVPHTTKLRYRYPRAAEEIPELVWEE